MGGHTAQLPSIHPWEVYTDWVKRYGSIYMIHLPGFPPRPVAVLSGYKSLQEIFVKRSSIYSTRPLWRMAELCGRQSNVAFTLYGSQLRAARKLLHSSFGARSIDE
jgi:cytochrome P450